MSSSLKFSLKDICVYLKSFHCWMGFGNVFSENIGFCVQKLFSLVKLVDPLSSLSHCKPNKSEVCERKCDTIRCDRCNSSSQLPACYLNRISLIWGCNIDMRKTTRSSVVTICRYWVNAVILRLRLSVPHCILPMGHNSTANILICLMYLSGWSQRSTLCSSPPHLFRIHHNDNSCIANA